MTKTDKNIKKMIGKPHLDKIYKNLESNKKVDGFFECLAESVFKQIDNRLKIFLKK